MVRDLSPVPRTCARCGGRDLLNGAGHCRACQGQLLFFFQKLQRRPRPERIRYTWGELGAGVLFAFAGALGTIVGLYCVRGR